MQNLRLKKRKIDLRQFVQRRAQDEDCPEILKDEFKLIDDETGKVVALYCKPQNEDSAFDILFNACLKTKFQETYRTSGLKTTSRIFGYNPRNAIRKDFCSIASYAMEQPDLHSRVIACGALAAKYYALHNPELYDAHLATTQSKVVADFKFSDVPFTSGIINDNNPLCYHFDSGNFKDVWSAMIVLKRDIRGGHLSMPEYGVSCEVADKSIFYFDGQNILHGVTQIIKNRPDARRFSIVYYSLKAMWNCSPLNEEIARARMKREQVELKRRKPRKV
jgi:hypothetical protein